MKKGTIIVIISALLMVGCSDSKKDIITDNSTNMNEKNEIINEDQYGNNEENEKLLKDLIIKREDVKIKGNEFSINNLQLRNEAVEKEYIKAINLVKEFGIDNSLDVIYEERIEDTISIFEGDKDSINLLTKLYNGGAETIHYFTSEDILNIDLSVNISVADISNITYSGVVYKASLINKDEKEFKFEDSKLNEFRELIVDKDSSINFKKLNSFIYKRLLGEYSDNLIFLNKLDDNSYEIISTENNNIYYKLVYDPKL